MDAGQTAPISEDRKLKGCCQVEAQVESVGGDVPAPPTSGSSAHRDGRPPTIASLIERKYHGARTHSLADHGEWMKFAREVGRATFTSPARGTSVALTHRV